LEERNLMRAADVPVSPGFARFGPTDITEADMKNSGAAVLIERLVAGGISHLSAERMLAIKRGAEPSRARTRLQSRR
jgi:hypothetical protein